MNFGHGLSGPQHHHSFAAASCGPLAVAPPVSTTQKGGMSVINDPANNREIQITSNGPGLDVAVFDTSTNPPTRDMSSWGDPHDVSKNGVTTDSHGNRNFKFKDGSTLNLGTANPDGSEPRPGQTGATFNSSAVYIPGNNPNSAAVITHQPGGQPVATTVTGSAGYIQSLKKEPAQAILLGSDGNFHSPDGQILTQQVQDAQDVIKGGPQALMLASQTSGALYGQAKTQEMFNHAAFQHAMHTAMACHAANYCNSGFPSRDMNFLYCQPGRAGLHQHKLRMPPNPYQMQQLGDGAHRYLNSLTPRGYGGATFDGHFGYTRNGWQPQNPMFYAMAFGPRW